MLDQQQRSRKIRRQLGQYFLQRHRPPGRGTNGHQLVAPLARGRTVFHRCRRCGCSGRARRSTARQARSRARGQPGCGGSSGRRGGVQTERATVGSGQGGNPLAQHLTHLVRVARNVLEVFRQIIGRTGVKRIQADAGTLVGKRGEHDHRRRTALHDLPDGFNAVHDRHLVVHGDHIRVQRQCLLDGLTTIVGSTDYLDLRIAGQNLRHPAAKETRIVDHQNLNRHTLS